MPANLTFPLGLSFGSGGGGNATPEVRQTIAFTDGSINSVTVSDGTTLLVNTNASTKFNASTITLPANPVANQTLTFFTTGEMQNIVWAGNGKTINGFTQLTAMVANTSATFKYSATDGWYLYVFDSQQQNLPSLTTTAKSFGAFGWRWIMPNVSTELDLSPGVLLHQATADGQGTRGSTVTFKAENTINVTDAAGTNGQNSYAGIWVDTYNSSIAYGGGATNDKQLNLFLANTGQKFGSQGAAMAWASSPSGINHWLSFQNAPFQFGSLTAGGAGQIWRADDVTGTFTMFKAIASASDQRDVGSASFTVAANVSNVILAGSGTVVVTMPAAPTDGYLVNLSLETAYTGVSVTNNTAQTIVAGAALTATAGTFATFRYRAANTKWYRVG